MKKVSLYSMLSILILTACSDSKNQHFSSESAAFSKELMEKNCFSCHNTQGTDNMLAPPMSRVKDHYWYEGISEKEFVKSIVEWCKNPTEEMSQMPGARRKFGLMPKQNFDSTEVVAIATYLFETELDNLGCSH